MKIRNFAEAERFLYTYIPREREQRFPGELGLRRARKLQELLGNPQERIKVVHVAGTSGKGSTAYLTSLLLQSLGFKTGFHVSPHLVDIRERCQINNRLISKRKFVEYLNEIVPAIEDIEGVSLNAGRPTSYDARRCVDARPTYFEILTALAFYIFWREGVDFAVVETGLGGSYDATNTVRRKDKLCILTRIGIDHTRVLGKTLKEIARQKAGIIGEGNKVVALRQRRGVMRVIREIGERMGADLEWVGDFGNVGVFRDKTVFDFEFNGWKMERVELGLLGRHQVENASLALAAVAVLRERKKFSLGRSRDDLSEQVLSEQAKDFGRNCRSKMFSLRQPRDGESEKKMRKALAAARFAGRLEVFEVRTPGDENFLGSDSPSGVHRTREDLNLSHRGTTEDTPTGNSAALSEEKKDRGWPQVKSSLARTSDPAQILSSVSSRGVEKEKIVIVDGAHNPQKMRALVSSLKEIFPGNRFTFLLAFSISKDAAGMLRYIVPLADKIIVTSFVAKGQDIIRVSQPPAKIAQALKKLRFADYEVVKNPQQALEKALVESDSTLAEKGGNIVITGSLYLIGYLYPLLATAKKG